MHTAEISGAGTKPLINLGGDTWVLFPWLGSYAFLALERMLKIKCAAELGLRGLDPSRPYFMQFKMKADEKTFFEVLAAEAEKDFDPIELVYPGEVPYFDRYDEFVPEELVRKGLCRRRARYRGHEAARSRLARPRLRPVFLGREDLFVVKDGAEEVGVEGHGFGKGVVAAAGDEQVVFLAAELRIATWDHPGVGEYLECRGSAVA